MNGAVPRLPEAAQRLAPRARMRTSPCGDGVVVWRVWGEGAPVVLLHGGSGSWNHWVRNIPALVARGHEVWAPDLPGFGESASPPAGEDADSCVAPLAEGLAELLPTAFDLVGFSFGSLVAALLARVTPRTHRLVLIGAPVVPLRMGRGVPLMEWRQLATEEDRAQVHAHNLHAIMLHRQESITSEAIAMHAINVPQDRMRRRRLSTTTLMADTMDALTCPTWMLYGAEDKLCRDGWAAFAERIRPMSAIRGVHLVPGAGHWVQFEAAAESNAQLLLALDIDFKETP